MAEQPDANEFTSYEEALMSQMITLDALVNVLERKGLITREEVIEEIHDLHRKAGQTGTVVTP